MQNVICLSSHSAISKVVELATRTFTMPDNNSNSEILNPKSASLRLTTGLLQSTSSRRTYHCRFVRARSITNTPSNIEISPQALQTACSSGLFNGKAVFIDHAALWNPQFYGAPSLENLVGVNQTSTWNEEDKSIQGTINLCSNASGPSIAIVNLIDSYSDELLSEPTLPEIGLGLSFAY